MSVKFNVQIYIDDKQVSSSDIPKIIIQNTSVDKIVNDVVKRNNASLKTNNKRAS